MKVNATTRGHRICQIAGEMVPDYDTPCIVLRFNEYGVEAAVHVAKDGTDEVGDELFSTQETSDDITGAMKLLESELRDRVERMAKAVRLAAPDPGGDDK